MTQAPTPGPLSASDIAHVRDYWSAICDSDWHLIPADIRDDLEERLAAVGLAEWRAVTDDDLEDTFAYECGIEKGRSCLDLTALGHLAFKSDADGWMPWSGGENPVGDAVVEVKFRDGSSDIQAGYEWHWNSEYAPIIAFRLTPTAPVEASGSEREHGPKCWGGTSFSDEMAHCYCGSTDLRPQPSGETREAVARVELVRGRWNILWLGGNVSDGTLLYLRSEADDVTKDAERYRFLRSRDPGPDGELPGAGPFIGQVPENLILTEQDADRAIDAALLSARPLALGGQHSGGERGWPTVMDALEATDQNWIVAKGRLTEDEPPYGCQILDGEDVIAEGECSTLSGAVSAALADLNGNTTPARAEAQDDIFGPETNAFGEPLNDLGQTRAAAANMQEIARQHDEAQDEGAAGETEALALDQLANAAEVVRRLLHNTKEVQGPAFREAGISFTTAIDHARAVLRQRDAHLAHPSPPPAADEDKVRIAVEALERWASGSGSPPKGEIRSTLAALKSTAAKEGEKK